ncbi:hypothetical protein PR002_g12402 [Phytophthora rubi]|uniref:Uncharacterized protein n=1 Tax=Phytophthora rubi TaxID=129364 RepID=A0A6A3LXC9_9STRA|nr:hypothetical protein PR002_g12402 [Phytophthora rubi]
MVTRRDLRIWFGRGGRCQLDKRSRRAALRIAAGRCCGNDISLREDTGCARKELVPLEVAGKTIQSEFVAGDISCNFALL